jgi:hypothetical protein
MGGEMSRIVVQFDRWADIVLAEGFDTVDFPDADAAEPFPCVIHEIALNLTKNIKGLEGDIQRKSLEETLFFTLGTRPHRVGSKLNGRPTVFLRRNGRGLLRRFLKLHLFNVVWLETSESFRAVAHTQNSFLQDMESVESACQRIVDSAWRSEKIRGTLNRSSAKHLINRIEALINS